MKVRTILVIASSAIPAMGGTLLADTIRKMCPACFDEHRAFFSLLATCPMALLAGLLVLVTNKVMNAAERRRRAE
jgi:hypothetical protein